MTRSEAEVFILTVISSGEVMDLYAIMKKYRGKTLKESLEDYFGELAPYCDIDQIVKDLSQSLGAHLQDFFFVIAGYYDCKTFHLKSS